MPGQYVLRSVRVRFLRRRPGSSVSLLTARDVMPEVHEELTEQLQDLLHCVWSCEAQARREDRIEHSGAARHKCAPPAVVLDNVAYGIHFCACGQRWEWSFLTATWHPM
jgi:hypothetical protein